MPCVLEVKASNHTVGSVHPQTFPISHRAQQTGDSDDGRDTDLAGHDRCVGEPAAIFDDDRRDVVEKLCPDRIGRLCYDDIALADRTEFPWSPNDTGGALADAVAGSSSGEERIIGAAFLSEET